MASIALRILVPLAAPLLAAAGCRAERPHTVASPVLPAPVARTDASAPDASTVGAIPGGRGVDATPSVSVPRGVGKRVAEIRVVDDARFWLLADGRAWETRDGGASFVDRTPFARARDDEEGWKEAWSLLVSPSQVFILRGDVELATWMTLFVSGDGGASFVERRVPRLRDGRRAWLQRGPAAGSILVLRSDGGGMNSHATSLLETRDAGASFRALGTKVGYGAVTFQTPKHWWSAGTCCAGESSVYRSLDAGRSWKLVQEGTSAWEPVSDVVFVDASRGYRVVRANDEEALALERTGDGGRSFQRVMPPSVETALLVADRDACVLVDDRSVPAITRDMGATWSSLAPLPKDMSSPRELVRAPHGWFAIVSATDTASAILLLRDGAGTWEELSPSWVEPPATR
ncbi:MAG: hypothetical protein QM820_46460 [Minicystis sp.]